MTTKSDKPHCLLIQKYASNILRYCQDMSSAEFVLSDVTYDACILNFINIGEQAKALSQSFKDNHKHIPFRKIVGLRNIAAHSYEGLEPLLLFQSIQTDIPVLLDQISEIVNSDNFD